MRKASSRLAFLVFRCWASRKLPAGYLSARVLCVAHAVDVARKVEHLVGEANLVVVPGE